MLIVKHSLLRKTIYFVVKQYFYLIYVFNVFLQLAIFKAAFINTHIIDKSILYNLKHGYSIYHQFICKASKDL